MAQASFEFLFRQKRIGGVTNSMDEVIISGVEISDTARLAVNWTAMNSALAGILTTQGLGATVTAGAFEIGKLYEIVTVGTTSFTGLGASANTVGVQFRPTGAGTGTGTVRAAQESNVLEGVGRIVLSGAAGYVGTGNGTLTQIAINSNTEVPEVWTITATSATNFTVSGSVSGAKAAATVGTTYDNGIIGFLITAGGTAFTNGGVWTLTVTKVPVLDEVHRDGIKVITSLSAVQAALTAPLTSLSVLP